MKIFRLVGFKGPEFRAESLEAGYSRLYLRKIAENESLMDAENREMREISYGMIFISEQRCHKHPRS